MIIQNKQKDFPIIYLRYLNNKLMYIGETHSFLGARHVREDISAGNFDIVKILKAPKDLKRRHYWEAYLIVKLKPLMNMQIDVYQYRYKIGNNIETKKRYFKTGSRKNPNKKVGKKFHLIEAYKNLRDFKLHMEMAQWEDKKN